MRFFVPLLLLLLVAACDTGETDDVEYPPPGSHPTLDLAEVESAEAGEYNVEAYVGDIFECPPNTECILPDNFTAVDVPPPAEPTVSVMVFAEQPSQLDIGAFYLFSLELEGEPESGRTVRLLGYDEIDPQD